MTETPPDGPAGAAGATTSGSGTPVPVDVSRDRRARIRWVVLLAGPVIGISHFMVVYLVAEAGCTGSGPGLRLFDPPVPDIVTLASTAVAALACVVSATWAHRRWRSSGAGEGPGAGGDEGERPADGIGTPDADAPIAFAGFLLSSVFLVMVLFVGVPAPLLAC